MTKELEERLKKFTAEQMAANVEIYKGITDNKSALSKLQAEINTRRQGYGEVWPSGFKYLDEKLDGGFLGEQLIFLGAISSLGKTSFALQIATQIAEQGKDVLIVSLEMSQNELNAKTISRYTYQLTERDEKAQKYRLTTRDILSGKVGGIICGADSVQGSDAKGKLYADAFEATRKIADHTKIAVGEGNINVDYVEYLVELHKRATGKSPFVILDYLQILQMSPGAQTADKRLLTDYDVTRLKIIARDYHIPVFVISAFNRNSYTDPVSMSSFRESSGIEYSSDILLGMQYHGMDYQKHWFTTPTGKHKLVYESEKDHNMRVRELLDNMAKDGAEGKALPIELKILKNRNGGRGSLLYDFVPAYNHYSEGTAHAYVLPDHWKIDEDVESIFSDNSKGKAPRNVKPRNIKKRI